MELCEKINPETLENNATICLPKNLNFSNSKTADFSYNINFDAEYDTQVNCLLDEIEESLNSKFFEILSNEVKPNDSQYKNEFSEDNENYDLDFKENIEDISERIDFHNLPEWYKNTLESKTSVVKSKLKILSEMASQKYEDLKKYLIRIEEDHNSPFCKLNAPKYHKLGLLSTNIWKFVCSVKCNVHSDSENHVHSNECQVIVVETETKNNSLEKDSEVEITLDYEIPDFILRVVEEFENLINTVSKYVKYEREESPIWSYLEIKSNFKTELMLVISGCNISQFREVLKNYFEFGPGRLLNISTIYFNDNKIKFEPGSDMSHNLLLGKSELDIKLGSINIQYSLETNFNIFDLKLLEETVSEYLTLDEEVILLDVGCELGILSNMLAHECSEIIGLTTSEYNLHHAQKLSIENNISNTKFMVCNPTNIDAKIFSNLKNKNLSMALINQDSEFGNESSIGEMLLFLPELYKIVIYGSFENSSNMLLSLLSINESTGSNFIDPFLPVYGCFVDKYSSIGDECNIVIVLERKSIIENPFQKPCNVKKGKKFTTSSSPTVVNESIKPILPIDIVTKTEDHAYEFPVKKEIINASKKIKNKLHNKVIKIEKRETQPVSDEYGILNDIGPPSETSTNNNDLEPENQLICNAEIKKESTLINESSKGNDNTEIPYFENTNNDVIQTQNCKFSDTGILSKKCLENNFECKREVDSSNEILSKRPTSNNVSQEKSNFSQESTSNIISQSELDNFLNSIIKLDKTKHLNENVSTDGFETSNVSCKVIEEVLEQKQENSNEDALKIQMVSNSKTSNNLENNNSLEILKVQYDQDSESDSDITIIKSNIAITSSNAKKSDSIKKNLKNIHKGIKTKKKRKKEKDSDNKEKDYWNENLWSKTIKIINLENTTSLNDKISKINFNNTDSSRTSIRTQNNVSREEAAYDKSESKFYHTSSSSNSLTRTRNSNPFNYNRKISLVSNESSSSSQKKRKFNDFNFYSSERYKNPYYKSLNSSVSSGNRSRMKNLEIKNKVKNYYSSESSTSETECEKSHKNVHLSRPRKRLFSTSSDSSDYSKRIKKKKTSKTSREKSIYDCEEYKENNKHDELARFRNRSNNRSPIPSWSRKEYKLKNYDKNFYKSSDMYFPEIKKVGENSHKNLSRSRKRSSCRSSSSNDSSRIKIRSKKTTSKNYNRYSSSESSSSGTDYKKNRKRSKSESSSSRSSSDCSKHEKKIVKKSDTDKNYKNKHKCHLSRYRKRSISNSSNTSSSSTNSSSSSDSLRDRKRSKGKTNKNYYTSSSTSSSDSSTSDNDKDYKKSHKRSNSKSSSSSDYLKRKKKKVK